MEINTAIIQPFDSDLQDYFNGIDWIDSSEFKEQDWNFKEIHEKLLKDWLKMDEQMELEWKESDALIENWHNEFNDTPIIKQYNDNELE